MPRTSKHQTKEQKKEYNRQYYLKRKLFYEEQGSTIYQANKERLLANNRKYLAANRDIVNQRRRDRYRQTRRVTAPDKLAGLFKDPQMKAHFMWLVERNKQKEENEISNIQPQ